MALLTQSYVHGASATPLIGETIGALLRRVTAEGPERIAQITRHQNVRWTYGDLLRRSEDLAVGLRRLGLKPGDRVGIWAANCSEWVLAQFGTALAGLILVNINPAYRVHEFEYAVRKSGCRALILSPGHKGNDYFASLSAVAPEIDGATPGRLKAAKLPKLEIVVRLGTEPTPGMFSFDEVAAPASEADAHGPRRLRRDAAVRRPDQHPVHLRHDGRAQGSDAHPPQHPQQRLLHRRGDAADVRGQALHPRALLPLLRHGARQPRLRHPRRGHGEPVRGVRPASPPSRPSRPRAAPACTACRPCSSPCSSTPSSAASTSRPFGPASWPARPVRSR